MVTRAFTPGRVGELARELREALYRARATMAEASRTCAEAFDPFATPALVRLKEIDRSMQAGVEDADRALIEYEKTNIFHLWVCEHCGTYQLPDGNDEDGPPECNHGMFFEDPSLGSSASEMTKVMVERMD